MNSTLNDRQQDRVVLLDAIPAPAADAAEPFIVGNERRVIVSYRMAESNSGQFGPFDDDDDPFCAVLFSDVVFHRLGPPGDDEIDNHPLGAQGLTRYAAHEVLDSSLVDEAATFASPDFVLRHFVLTFQDTTFECVATDFTVVGVYGSGEIAGREAFSLFR